MTERPLELLHAIARPDSTFRPGQREFHLSSVYRKLGVRSGGELTRLFAEANVASGEDARVS